MLLGSIGEFLEIVNPTGRYNYLFFFLWIFGGAYVRKWVGTYVRTCATEINAKSSIPRL